MRWIASSEKDADTKTLEKRLWDAADSSGRILGLSPRSTLPPSLA